MNRNARLSLGVLDDILETKRAEVERLRPNASRIRERAESRAPAPDFTAALRAGSGTAVIAEVKRRSPSAGAISPDSAAVDVAGVYSEAGAAAISVLTDGPYFGGALEDLERVADAVSVPLLRKDFTVDAVQIHEARAAGASAVLLIARALDDAELADFRVLAEELGMAALVEVHDEAEVERSLRAGAAIVGINNRDLATFTTDLAVTERLARYVPPDVVLVSESGIRTDADVRRVAEHGADAVLVGEALMRDGRPDELIAAFSAVPRGLR